MRTVWGRGLGKVVPIALATSLAVGCGQGDESSSDEGVEEGALQAGENGGESCVADYADAPCELLTPDLVRAQFPDAPPDVEGRSLMPDMCNYRWPSDRVSQRTFQGQTIESEETNDVGLNHIDTYKYDPPERFRTAYLRENRGRDQAMLEEHAEQEGLDEAERETAEDIVESAAGSMRFEPIDGIGDMASWGGPGGGGTLYVLDGDTKFEIASSVSADESENREAAIRLARAVMAACD